MVRFTSGLYPLGDVDVMENQADFGRKINGEFF